MERLPVRLTLTDDLRRSRLTVGFRLVLGLPHIVWFVLWSLFSFGISFVQWLVVLFTGEPTRGLHELYVRYIRYLVHVYAYMLLAADPYPGFFGRPGYPVDVEFDGPERQSRWKTGFRLLLAFPALMLAGVLLGSQPQRLGNTKYFLATPGLAAGAAFLAWFAVLASGRMPRGFRDLAAYAIGYTAQTYAYLFFLTARYPDSDPGHTPSTGPAPGHPVRVEVDDPLRRSRLTVFFRLALAAPHIVWLLLWSVVAFPTAILNWVATLVRGRSPAAFHRFLSRWLRYGIHVSAFLYLVGNPFPGFTGRAGRYPIDVVLPQAPQRQSRWTTGFRIFLAIPALVISSGLGGALAIVALLGWFASIFTGRMPGGLRNLGAFALHYQAQLNAYVYLLTDRYPYSGPVGGEPDPVDEPAVALAA